MKTNLIKATCKGDKEDNIPNQDYIKVFEDYNILVVTVSDGLGSSKYSLEGAKKACEIVVSESRKINNNVDVNFLNESILNKWEKSISSKIGERKDYRTTNSFIAVLKNCNKIVIGQLGDVFVSIRIDGLFRHLGINNKDFINETNCLGSGNNEKYKLTIFDYNVSFDFLIATDGIGDELIEDKQEMLHNFFINKYKNIPDSSRNKVLKKEITEFLNEKNNDDKSLVFVWLNKK